MSVHKELVKIAVIGNVNAGKSSLIGVLTSGQLDDGNGKARAKVIKNPHEALRGQTSTVNYHYLYRNKDVVTLVDLCGHEKYYRTTLYGLGVSRPDVSLIVIAANDGMKEMTKQHIESVLSLKLPIFIVITKIDYTPENVLKKNIEDIERQFKRVKMILDTGSEKKLNLKSRQETIPTFFVSNKDGAGIDELKDFFFSLQSPIFNEDKPKHQINTDILYIDSIYNKQGIGTIYSGYFRGNSIKKGDHLKLGPTPNGHFISVKIRNIHNAFSQDVDELNDGESGSVAVAIEDNFKRFFRKGIIICRDLKEVEPYVCNKFSCDLAISKHSTTVKVGFTPVVHCCGVMRTAKFSSVNNGNNIIRCGEKGTAEMQFLYKSKHLIIPGSRFVFREGKNRGYGTIVSVLG